VFIFISGAAFFIVVGFGEEEADELEAGRMTADVEGLGVAMAVVDPVARGLGVV
jgi:hypothetical protein